MPLLASLMVGLFGSLAGFFAKFFAEKVAFALAAVAAFATLTTGMVAASGVAIQALLQSFPSNLGTALDTAMWLVGADSLNIALDAAFAADAAIFLYRWGVGNIKIVASA